jgi:hypothetical protein
LTKKPVNLFKDLLLAIIKELLMENWHKNPELALRNINRNTANKQYHSTLVQEVKTVTHNSQEMLTTQEKSNFRKKFQRKKTRHKIKQCEKNHKNQCHNLS